MTCVWISETDPSRNDNITGSIDHRPASSTKRTSNHERRKPDVLASAETKELTKNRGFLQFSIVDSSSRNSNKCPVSGNIATSKNTSFFRFIHVQAFGSCVAECSAPLRLHIILSNLPAIHLKFFDMLDAELTKVGTFYAEREKQMHEHDKLLRMQLEALGVHREMFYVGALCCD
ncbi:hypothetical protein JVT61DRAFT_10065 [Boletus reticuloceps]|uniref:SPX domain-containing protein n=1 Tax=Boletus reticuloceps TaxID=495285 RepID=A0A8I3ADL9_9AGAM|nr:hypothetical protein JVT61DRAFT_10065 [Boletus reticuloceps]